MNRNIAPRFGDIQMPVVPTYSTTPLPNGALLHVLRGGTQPVVKVDLMIKAGTIRSDKSLVAKATADLFAEGTPNHTSKEIASIIDFYGAYAWTAVTGRTCTISMMCLSRDVANVMPLFEEVVKHPTFPQEEIDLYVAQKLQDYDVDILKSSYNAAIELRKSLYSDGERYARFATRDDIQNNLTTENLKAFHTLAYHPNGAHIFISGQPTDDDIRIIADALGSNWEKGEEWESPMPHFRDEVSGKFVNFKGEQTSFRMARKAFERSHADFLPMLVANVALGGYFGSRLMQTLREKLGLTYGVSSYIASSSLYGIMGISSEIKVGSHKKVIEIINQEMEKLTTELIPDSEMDVIRGVMLGDLLRYFESVTSSSETLLSFIIDNVPGERVAEFYNILRTITPAEVRDVARRWLEPEKFNIVCVGPGVE